ncbi:MAG: alpha/beta hydrolase [Candidatus Acidiferrum sp.]
MKASLVKGLLVLLAASAGHARPQAIDEAAIKTTLVTYHTAQVDGLKIFYREAGPKNAPTILLLHGFPTSSHMYRELIPRLSDKYHVLAPDFPGYGYSDMPAPVQYAYTFDHLADTTEHLLDQLGVQKYSIYIMDYGAPVGFRLATRHPEKIQVIITQNGNAYDEGLGPFWAVYFYPMWKDRNATTEAAARKLLTFDSTKYQYTQGFRNPEHVSPDSYTLDQLGLDRPGNDQIQLDLAYDYRTNPPLYPSWQKYLREKKPPVLIVWGKNDPIFIAPGAQAFLRDVPNAEIHMLDTGHFALEEDGAEIAAYMRAFLATNVH